MSWVRVKDSSGNVHIITKAALKGVFAGHGLVVINDTPAPKKNAKKSISARVVKDDNTTIIGNKNDES